ncbi:MAG TPA: M48 family peptidase [Methyloprofundus sp.]|nr:M48 family peptidase [Methyloprofundus sp.]
MLIPHLVKAPKECIDYVILHELYRIPEHHHSEKFWRLFTQVKVMPHWKEVKVRINAMAQLHLNE